MASQNVKIKAPNFTMIPNVIFDHWMKTLSHLQFKVLLCICRKTLGWNKDRDMLSLNQISDLTNSSKDGVRECLKVLESHGLIKKHISTNDYGSSNPNVYEIDIHEDPPVVSFAHLYDLTPPGVGDSSDQGVGDSSDPQKKENKINIKEIYKEKEEVVTAPLQPPKSNFSKRTTLKEEKIQKADRVFVTPSQHLDLLKKANQDELLVQKWYDKLNTWKVGKNKIGGSRDYIAINDWVIQRVKDDLSEAETTLSSYPSPSVPHSSAANWKWAILVKEKFDKEVEINSEGLLFNSMIGSHPYKFSDHNFREKVLNRLKTMKLSIDGL
tara:strand:- start:836 stop:1810 length:975 start_codon:yes stop_codon:yes gene_type:complete